MRLRNFAALASIVVALGFVGGAAAQPNQHEGGAGSGGSGAGGEVGGELGGSLPFTGFQAGIVLLVGTGVAATGLALRRSGRSKST